MIIHPVEDENRTEVSNLTLRDALHVDISRVDTVMIQLVTVLQQPYTT